MKNKKSIYYITKTALASVFLIICSLIKIPFFVPFTLQSFGVFLVAGLMPECAVVSVLIFILLGVLGVPVFSAGTGAAVFLSPTSGFILGFIITAFLASKVFKRKPCNKINKKFLSQTLFLFLCQMPTYILGCVTMIIFTNASYSVLKILTLSVLPFIIPDIFKIILAQTATMRIAPFLKSKNL